MNRVMLVVFVMLIGCAPTLKQGNVVRQFDTPTSHYEKSDLVNGAGRVDTTEVGWSDIPGGGMGFGVAPTGPGVTSVHDMALRSLAPQPGPLSCDLYREGDRQYGQCRPATDETFTIEMTPAPAPRR